MKGRFLPSFNQNLLTKPNLVREQIHGRRFYRTESDNLYPSVTTLLDSFYQKDLAVWRARVGDKTADAITHRARVRGTRLHKLLEQYVLNEEIDFRQEMPSAVADFESIRETIDQNVEEVFGAEFPLFSDNLMIAGTTDLICVWNGVRSIVDLKTSRKVKPEEWIEDYFVQSTIYGIMANELFNIDVEQIVVLILAEHERPNPIIKHLTQFREKAYEVCIKKRPPGFYGR